MMRDRGPRVVMGGVISSMVLLIALELFRGEFRPSSLLVAVMVIGIFYLGLSAWSAFARKEPGGEDGPEAR